jgi:hypothetical protein
MYLFVTENTGRISIIIKDGKMDNVEDADFEEVK